VKYALTNGVGSYSPSSLFSSILSKVDVPSSFEVAKPKAVAKASSGSQASSKQGALISLGSNSTKRSIFAPSMSSVMASCQSRSNFNAYAHCIKDNYKRNPSSSYARSFFVQLRAIQEDYQAGSISDSKARAEAYKAFDKLAADSEAASSGGGKSSMYCYSAGTSMYCN
jgi:hypothetical protein